MRRIRRSTRAVGWVAVLVIAALAGTPGAARAQFMGGMGFGYPAFGYGMYGNPYGFGYPGMNFGAMGYGLGYPGMGFGFGYPGTGYGLGYGAMGYGLGYPGLGYMSPYTFGYPGFSYAGPLFSSPYENSLFGLGLSPLGVNSYYQEANLLGRGQLRARQGGGAPVYRVGR